VGRSRWRFVQRPSFAVGGGDYTEAAALLEQEWRMPDDDLAGFKLLARVAKQLNTDLRLDLPRTDDFVVFAIDPEIPDQAHVERHLRVCIPASIFKVLKRRGLSFVEP
jgi:hypothetical protein